MKNVAVGRVLSMFQQHFPAAYGGGGGGGDLFSRYQKGTWVG